MTLSNIARQLYNSSVGGFFNREKFSEERLLNYLSSMMRTGNSLVMEIALPDGWWFFTVTRYAKGRDGFDYMIPDTREQESRITAALAK